MSKPEAWAITAAVLLVIFAIPTKVFRWALLGGAALFVLALFLL